MIEVRQASFSYPGGHVALREVSLRLLDGEFLAVVGPNGSGKSTLLRFLNALELPDSGSVIVDTMNTADPALTHRIRERVGMVFQHPDEQIVATSVLDDVAFGPENLGLPRDEIRMRVEEALSATGLSGLEHREPHLLSGGQKQRLAIAGALAMRPRHLVLDEPTSMLDPLGRREVKRILAQQHAAGRSILLVTHDLSQVLDADRIVVLVAGRIVAEGRPVDILSDPDELAGWGLEAPPLLRLARALRERGLSLPAENTTVEAIAGAL